MKDATFLQGVAAGFGLAVVLYVILRFLAQWTRALCCGVHVRMTHIIGMRLRGSPPGFLIDAYCSLVHSGQRTSMREVESCYIAEKHTMRPDDMSTFMELVKKRIAERARAETEGTDPAPPYR
jgi:uncharacterized protein YqfA (UPF0365 family)